MARRAVTLPFGPDNVHLQANGKLMILGPNPPGPATCNGAPSPMGWTVVEMDPDTLAFSRVGGADGSVHAATCERGRHCGNEIWVGSDPDRIARFTPK